MIESLVKSTLVIKWSHLGMVVTASGSAIALDIIMRQDITMDIPTIISAFVALIAVLVSLYAIINTSRNDIAKILKEQIDDLRKTIRDERAETDKDLSKKDDEIGNLKEQVQTLLEGVDYERNLRMEWEQKYKELEIKYKARNEP